MFLSISAGVNLVAATLPPTNMHQPTWNLTEGPFKRKSSKPGPPPQPPERQVPCEKGGRAIYIYIYTHVYIHMYISSPCGFIKMPQLSLISTQPVVKLLKKLG